MCPFDPADVAPGGGDVPQAAVGKVPKAVPRPPEMAELRVRLGSMRIVTNPGCNLPAAAIRHFDLEICPQQIVVDGVSHDTRAGIPYPVIDGWVRTASDFPHVVGTTAHEFAAIFARLAKETREIVTILASRKIIQTYGAAASAARTLAASAAFGKTPIHVVDCKMTDSGLGLFVLAASTMGEAGVPGYTIARCLNMLAERSFFAFVPGTLDNLVKGGRAGWARAQMADFFNIKPIIAFQDGELAQQGKVRGSGDVAGALVDMAVKRVGAARKVWGAVFHTYADDTVARDVASRLHKALPLTYATLRPLSSSIYLHAGPGAVGVAVLPMDDLPVDVPIPPDFAGP